MQGGIGGSGESRRSNAPVAPASYRPQVLLNWSVVFALVGVGAALYTREDYTVTGYLRDFGALWVVGIVLAIEASYLLPSARPVSLIIGCFCLIPPIDRFFSYGQRGDTFRIASMAIPYFLLRGIRPPRVAVIPLAIARALTLGTLDRTRILVGTGEASGRIDALFKVIPSFFDQTPKIQNYGGKEYIFGSAMIATVRDEQSYEYGGFLYNIGVRFLPKEIFDKSELFTEWNNTHYTSRVGAHGGFEVTGGAAPTGFANLFVEFGWVSPVVWLLLGYLTRVLYVRATRGAQLSAIAYLVAFFIVLLYLITQDVYAPTMNAIYLFPTLFIAFKTARVISRRATDGPQVVPQLIAG